MTTTNKEVALFKVKPIGCIPQRKGAIQCIRKCSNCFTSQELSLEISEEMANLKTYDDLVACNYLWFSKYQTIQYHGGQIDLLKAALGKRPSNPVIFVVATTQSSDVDILNSILEHVHMPEAHRVTETESNLYEILLRHKTIAIPIWHKSCVVDTFYAKRNAGHGPSLRPVDLRDLIQPLIEKVQDKPDCVINIVPVSITKDHSSLSLFGLGSTCVVILEPYTLHSYILNLDNNDAPTHITKHLYNDVAINASVFSSHLVAFLILYLERENGVKFHELVDYVGWFQRSSIDFGMQIGFNGQASKATQFALMILKDYILPRPEDLYYPGNLNALKDYASLVLPIIAYYGVVSRAILLEYNNTHKTTPQTIFSPKFSVRVEREAVIKRCLTLANDVERKVPCRKPCITIDRKINETMDSLELGHYLRVEEPKAVPTKRCNWAGDFDSDDEYFKYNNDNPAFKTYIILTTKDIRLDRLNLFVNAIDMHHTGY